MGLAARSRNRTGIGTANPLYKLKGGPPGWQMREMPAKIGLA